jgi:hypothetical protein
VIIYKSYVIDGPSVRPRSNQTGKRKCGLVVNEDFIAFIQNVRLFRPAICIVN